MGVRGRIWRGRGRGGGEGEGEGEGLAGEERQGVTCVTWNVRAGVLGWDKRLRKQREGRGRSERERERERKRERERRGRRGWRPLR